jgi:DNA-binding GntR family transcriptional regulator
MDAASWPQPAVRTLAEQVYRAVRARILDGGLAPGEFLRERDLEAMGVSRTPIREALGRLASEGFLERIPHRGFRVPEEPVGNLLELYPIVAALELLAGKLALPRLTPEDISRLREINRKLGEARDRQDVRIRIELNNQFHHVFSERSGNQRLSDLLDDLRMQLARLELWYYSSGEHTQESVREHDEIIRALEAGDQARALSVLENNMSLTYRSLLRETEVRGER